jgi:NTP pyrophosphatase (non-canonical NTP hydrolase)
VAPPAAAPAHAVRIDILLDEPIGTIEPTVYSRCAEHIGGVIHDGIGVGPDSPVANIDGVRRSLVEHVRRFGRWREAIEPNHFGTHEFIRFCRLCDAAPYFAAKVGTGSAEEFQQWVEYANAPAGITTWRILRQSVVLPTDEPPEAGIRVTHELDHPNVDVGDGGPTPFGQPPALESRRSSVHSRVRRPVLDGSRPGGVDSQRSADPAEAPTMKISEFQKLIADLYLDRDRARGLDGTYRWFVEEVGELARALRLHASGRATDGGRNLREEFADVLAWLVTLASIVEVDVEAAAREKYAAGCPKCAASPCACPTY